MAELASLDDERGSRGEPLSSCEEDEWVCHWEHAVVSRHFLEGAGTVRNRRGVAAVEHAQLLPPSGAVGGSSIEEVEDEISEVETLGHGDLEGGAHFVNDSDRESGRGAEGTSRAVERPV